MFALCGLVGPSDSPGRFTFRLVHDRGMLSTGGSRKLNLNADSIQAIPPGGSGSKIQASGSATGRQALEKS